MADPADIAHLLRRTEFVVQAQPPRRADAPLTLDAGRRRHPRLAPNGAPQLPAYLITTTANSGWDQFVVRLRLVGRPHGHAAPAVPGEDDAVLARPLRQRAGGTASSGVDHMMRQNQLYRDTGPRQLPRRSPSRWRSSRRCCSTSSTPTTSRVAERELRPRADGAVHPRRRQLHRGRRRGRGPGVDRPQLRLAQLRVRLQTDRHDTGNKTFFGTTKNWDGPEIINEILRDNAGKRLIAARFITRKLWEFFAHPGRPANVVDELADVFVADEPRDQAVDARAADAARVLLDRRPSRVWCARRPSSPSR